MNLLFAALAVTFIPGGVMPLDNSVATVPPTSFRHGHTNNWAVLVDTSRFWFNYRHVANVLSIYRRFAEASF
jgi:glycosylphosphatidylinositol transamidase (GPIT) subunit GPI8